MATIKQIAEQAGVSPTTVANVIHGRTAKVSAAKLAVVRSILERERYAPNMGAIMLARSRSRIVAVVIFREPRRDETVLDDPFSSTIIGSIEREIREAGYYMMLHTTDHEEDVLKLVAKWKLAGLILMWVSGEMAGIIRRSTETPAVFIDCFFDNDGQTYHNVSLDDEKGGEELAKYLLSMGHRRIAFLADSGSLPDTATMRFEGAKRAFAASALTLGADRFLILSKDRAERQETYRRLTVPEPPYTALAFFADYYAAEAVLFCQENGIDVPGRVSITGFDDNIFAHMVRPRLTTVYQDAALRGKQAVTMLMSLIRNEPVESASVRSPVLLRVRDSVRAVGPE